MREPITRRQRYRQEPRRINRSGNTSLSNTIELVKLYTLCCFIEALRALQPSAGKRFYQRVPLLFPCQISAQLGWVQGISGVTTSS